MEALMRLGWALALLLPCAPAWAEGFAARSLGASESAGACAKKGAKTLDAYLLQNGGDEILATPNAVFGWDLMPGEADAMLLCPTVDGAGIWAMVVVHSEGTDEERNAVADGIVALWGSP